MIIENSNDEDQNINITEGEYLELCNDWKDKRNKLNIQTEQLLDAKIENSTLIIELKLSRACKGSTLKLLQRLQRFVKLDWNDSLSLSILWFYHVKICFMTKQYSDLEHYSDIIYFMGFINDDFFSCFNKPAIIIQKYFRRFYIKKRFIKTVDNSLFHEDWIYKKNLFTTLRASNGTTLTTLSKKKYDSNIKLVKPIFIPDYDTADRIINRHSSA